MKLVIPAHIVLFTKASKSFLEVG